MKKRIPIKYIYDKNPFYVHFKKHYCPKCNCIMKTKYYSKIINSNSPEAKFYDFSLPDAKLTGDVEFRKSLFYCPSCNLEVSFEEMKRIETAKLQ